MNMLLRLRQSAAALLRLLHTPAQSRVRSRQRTSSYGEGIALAAAKCLPSPTQQPQSYQPTPGLQAGAGHCTAPMPPALANTNVGPSGDTVAVPVEKPFRLLRCCSAHTAVPCRLPARPHTIQLHLWTSSASWLLFSICSPQQRAETAAAAATGCLYVTDGISFASTMALAGVSGRLAARAKELLHTLRAACGQSTRQSGSI